MITKVICFKLFVIFSSSKQLNRISTTIYVTRVSAPWHSSWRMPPSVLIIVLFFFGRAFGWFFGTFFLIHCLPFSLFCVDLMQRRVILDNFISNLTLEKFLGWSKILLQLWHSHQIPKGHLEAFYQYLIPLVSPSYERLRINSSKDLSPAHG